MYPTGTKGRQDPVRSGHLQRNMRAMTVKEKKESTGGHLSISEHGSIYLLIEWKEE